MSDWPRVAFIAGTLGHGGAERQLFEHCRILVEAGASPVVLCLTQGEEWEVPIRGLGVEVAWVGRRSGRLARLVAVTDQVRRCGAEVVQASHSMANLYAVGAGRLLRRPAIGALRTTPDRAVASLGRLGRTALRSPDVLVGNSRANLEAARGLGVRSDRVRYVPNAVDLVRFQPGQGHQPGHDRGGAVGSPQRPPADSVGSDSMGDGAEVLFVGRLSPEKRVGDLIEAVAQLRQNDHAASLSVVGDGPLADQLVSLSRDRGVDDAVHFVGLDPEPEKWLKTARVLVLPSEREGTPNVVLEAMASGLPVVATRVGSLPELVEDGVTGWLVPVGDPRSLAHAIARVLDDPAGAQAMGMRARQRVEQGFDRAAVKEGLAQIYRHLGHGRWPCAA